MQDECNSPLPLQHCAFQGCAWSSKEGGQSEGHTKKEMSLENHILKAHFLLPQHNGNCSKHWRPLLHEIMSALGFGDDELLLGV